MFKITAVLLALSAFLGACGDDGDDSATETTTTSTTAPAPTPTTEAAAVDVDPYDEYLRLAPAGEETLSREDAQARAYLGCGQEWAPGTVDRALADAYRPTGICG